MPAISWVAGRLVDPFELALLADFAVLVTGQRFGDEVARIRRDHDAAPGVVIADGHGADVIVTPVAGIERQTDSRRTVDTSRGDLDAHGDADSCPGVVVSAPGADAIDARNAGSALKASAATQAAITGIRRNMDGSPKAA